MLIQEEYAKRHDLPMPLANYTLKNGVAFLQSTGSYRLQNNVKHIMMSIRWIPHDRHPGVYELMFRTPIHDSYQNRANYLLVQEYQDVSYEDIESCIKQNCKQTFPGYQAVTETKSISLFVWEMFVCCYDGWIARNGSAKLLSNIEASIDPSLSMEARYLYYKSAISTICEESEAAYEKWEMNFAIHRNKNLPWLGKLFNGD